MNRSDFLKVVSATPFAVKTMLTREDESRNHSNVHDSGIAIPEEFRSEIELFMKGTYTANEIRRIEGLDEI